MKSGGAGVNVRNLLIERAGVLEFVRDLDDRAFGPGPRLRRMGLG
ncbi:hypothetical protein AADA15_15810 [Phycobacter sp. 'Weihai']